MKQILIGLLFLILIFIFPVIVTATSPPHPCQDIQSIENFDSDKDFLDYCLKYENGMCANRCYNKAAEIIYLSDPNKALSYCEKIEGHFPPCYKFAYTGLAIKEKNIQECGNIRKYLYSNFHNCVMDTIKEMFESSPLDTVIANCLAINSSEYSESNNPIDSMKLECLRYVMPKIVERNPDEAIAICNNLRDYCPEVIGSGCENPTIREIIKQFPGVKNDPETLCSKFKCTKQAGGGYGECYDYEYDPLSINNSIDYSTLETDTDTNKYFFGAGVALLILCLVFIIYKNKSKK